MTREELAWLRIHLTNGLGRTGLIRLMETFGGPEAILAAEPVTWIGKAGIRPAVAAALPPENDPRFLHSVERLDRIGAKIVTLWDEGNYPAALRTIYDPPALLYLRGEMPGGECFAVVGARNASSCGLQLAYEISAELAARGIFIVSGLARGIDSAAHRGALKRGRTVAVLGCGIDQIYPLENRRLTSQIIDSGGVLSEYPPGTPPLPGHFPGRNRIISGLSRGVLVVEAAAKSGSLLTADFALEQGREVFAVPGQVHLEGSTGVNRLLKEGAHLVTDAEDILLELWPDSCKPNDRNSQDQLAANLSGKTLSVYLALGPEPQHIDELARKCTLTPMELSAILLHLELANGAVQLPGMRYIRKNFP
ncbi:MAG: DNA-processing protein DprA [Syntrophotaleaceae bacterium]